MNFSTSAARLQRTGSTIHSKHVVEHSAISFLGRGVHRASAVSRRPGSR